MALQKNLRNNSYLTRFNSLECEWKIQIILFVCLKYKTRFSSFTECDRISGNAIFSIISLHLFRLKWVVKIESLHIRVKTRLKTGITYAVAEHISCLIKGQISYCESTSNRVHSHYMKLVSEIFMHENWIHWLRRIFHW